MNPFSSPDYSSDLHRLMEEAGLSTVKELSQKTGVSQWQIIRLRRGLARQMRVEILLKISQGLNISLVELLATFAPESVRSQDAGASVKELQQEYQHLQSQMEKQRELLLEEFERSSLSILEAWLLQWPTVAYKVQQNPKLAGVKLLPLLRPVERLMQQWGVEAIASVGSEIPYNPQMHQLLEGTAQTGEMVVVRYAGYRYRGQLLYRVKVSPLQKSQQ
ncbi:MAG: helix-turn-helix transcriptional regulator [Limnoraphis robusta]|uniref:XRE family transcriptional regulator n=1 Tax=Limnoraphis robusta CS-951 TaxID=1637645 RepID=A0A0J9HLU2_9CYAN|nr:helix-turn-helix transcriptional regulator [Limnoraphis robusta]KMW70164.1 XRE family transcriptional regulator [Limnoraphis robusta CS-951]